MANIPPEYPTNPRQAWPDNARPEQQPYPAYPDRRSLFVPKRFGIGYSPNFANPVVVWGCLIGVIALIATAILVPLITVLLTTHH